MLRRLAHDGSLLAEVSADTIAPWFGQLRLGTQYVLPDSVANLIEAGYIKLAEDGG